MDGVKWLQLIILLLSVFVSMEWLTLPNCCKIRCCGRDFLWTLYVSLPCYMAYVKQESQKSGRTLYPVIWIRLNSKLLSRKALNPKIRQIPLSRKALRSIVYFTDLDWRLQVFWSTRQRSKSYKLAVKHGVKKSPYLIWRFYQDTLSFKPTVSYNALQKWHLHRLKGHPYS